MRIGSCWRLGRFTAIAIVAAALLGAACGDDFSGQTLTLVTHDSFAISEETIAAFEAEHDVTVEILPAGDAVEALNRVILTRGNPIGDVMFGVDNISYVRALREGVFEEYESPELENVDGRWIFDDSNRVTPINYGYVLFNYQKAALESGGLAPPTTLEELTLPDWRGRVAVEDPNTSSPGQQFMLATIAYFGENGQYTWLDFWRDMRANDVIVTSGWEDAYYAQFVQYGGEAWMVMSYATSPPAEVIFAEQPLDSSPTANVLIPTASYLQIEGVGILEGTPRRALAEKFIDFMLGARFQEDIPGNMFVYPVRRGASLPQEFVDFADVPDQPAELDAEQVEANLERWLDEWSDVVLR